MSQTVPPPITIELGKSKGFVGHSKESFSPIKLHFAVNKNDIDAVKNLIDKKVDLNYMVFGQTPLAVSIFKEHFDISCLLVDSGAILDQPEKSKWRRLPIHLASHSGNYELVEKILEHHPQSVHARDAMMFTALHWAATMGHVKIVELLISYNSDVDAVDDRGKSPLHRAAENDQIEAALCLLVHGADANKQDIVGWTPICQPVICQNIKMVELLLENSRINLNLKDRFGKSCLHLSCNPKSEHNLRALIQSSLDITTRHLKTSTPAILKVLLSPKKSQEEYVKIVSLLINYRADCNLKDDLGETPLSIAITLGLSEVIVIFLNAGSDFNELITLTQCPENLISHKSLFENILRIAKNRPHSLKKLCKLVIRKYVKLKIDDNIKDLPLPNYLIGYLQLCSNSLDE